MIDDESDSIFSDPISESLAKLVITRSSEEMQGNLLAKKVEKYPFPSNCKLVNTRLNPEIWSSLSKSARNRDARYGYYHVLWKAYMLRCHVVWYECVAIVHRFAV